MKKLIALVLALVAAAGYLFLSRQDRRARAEADLWAEANEAAATRAAVPQQ